MSVVLLHQELTGEVDARGRQSPLERIPFHVLKTHLFIIILPFFLFHSSSLSSLSLSQTYARSRFRADRKLLLLGYSGAAISRSPDLQIGDKLEEINRAIKLYFVEKFSLASGL